MHVAIYLPLLVAAVLGATAPHLSRALPPATATRLLAGAGVATATATSFVLGVLTFTLVAEFGPVARLGSWSTSRLDASNPVPDGASIAAGATVCVLAFFVVRAVVRSVRATLAARRLCGELGGEPGDLVVIDGPDVRVFALPALRGRIVATRPLLAALPADERRAVLAHETAHLRNHHHRYRLAAELAAAVNPLLRPLARGVDYATERWADEAAAGTVGDRRVVARALARCGLGLRLSAPGRRRPCTARASRPDWSIRPSLLDWSAASRHCLRPHLAIGRCSSPASRPCSSSRWWPSRRRSGTRSTCSRTPATTSPPRTPPPMVGWADG